ncbi:hypothetical protein GPDM_03135 [Planococcus donghaensis MPA1U2]|uniref:Extracellular solute-binding protein n=1 Tax=Planococcus donghaensis MPA1U2 TaxID=933115 RepID=E7RDU9_9BACL|nr:extracellular solute-binding protein [Planococcus donghaensis]EGA90855.1 hypothetical protein GPDM_03135 [Planococcus donghaensis MPA1U2]
MKLKVFLIVSILIMVLSVSYIISMLNQDFVLSQETKYEATLNVWTTTPELSVILKQFQGETNIQMNIKQFQNSELLMEELELTKLNNKFPELVEIPANYGIANMKSDYNIQPIDGFMEKDLFHTAARELFSEKAELYAFPLGIEIPVLYYNKTLLTDEIKKEAFPFQEKQTVEQFKAFQDKKNKGNSNKQFWMFHFDEQVSWYWDSYSLSRGASNTLQLEDSWSMLYDQYELVPPFDSPMAITRFVNSQVGALISNSKHIYTIQQLIGNRFEFEAQPFRKESNDRILISGKGLAVTGNPETDPADLEQLFRFLDSQEIQLQLLSATGILPAQKELLENAAFIRKLPMAKYLLPLAKENPYFTGTTDERKLQRES